MAAQSKTDSLLHRIYLIGNTAGIEQQPMRLQQFKERLERDKTDPQIVFLGDYIRGNNEKEKLTKKEKQAINELTYGLPKKRTFFIDGDRDWNDSGRDGDDKVEDLEDYIQKDLAFAKAVIPSDACAGPKVIELSEQLIIVGINTQWLFHPYQKPELTETDCRTLNLLDFWDEMEDILDENRDKNILFVAHHPVYAVGRYSGEKLGFYHAIPVIGSFIHAYRRQIGTPADMAFQPYLDYQKRLLELLESHQGVIYAAGHEFDLEVHRVGENFHLNSGSFAESKPVGRRANTLYSSAEQGFLQLDYYANGDVILHTLAFKKEGIQSVFQQKILHAPNENITNDVVENQRINQSKFAIQNVDNQGIVSGKDSSKYFIPGDKFAASKVKIGLLGNLWRAEWLTPTRLPFIDLNTKFSGLRPIGIGGGGQTYSVILKGGNDKEYAFRLLEKDPVKKYSERIKATVYGRVVQDMVAGQHPFGVSVVDRLLDATDIIHTQSEFYMLPQNAPLGKYSAQFAGQPGVLEIRAKDGFKGSDDVKSTDKMFRKAYKNNKVRINAKQYIKARLFDLMIGDFDRHRKNWKWVGYDTEDGIQYEPMPRDRDYAFAKLEGFILGTADKFTPNGGNFHDTPRRVGALTFKGRFLDRQLAPYVSWNEYEAVVTDLQNNLTDAVIADAVAQLPDEIEVISTAEMNRKLRIRRDTMLTYARTFYEQLAREPEIVGSNKREIFDIERLADGSVKVAMYDQKDGDRTDLLLQRVFYPNETQELRLYGLGADDVFNVSGDVKESILIRIIGGKGDDIINDNSQSAGIKRLTKVYDTPFRDSVKVSKETKLLSPKLEAQYDPLGFRYNSLVPFPKFRISSGNGFGIQLETTVKRMGFNKPDFKQKHEFQAIYYSIDAHRFDIQNRFRHVLGFWDVEFHHRLAYDYDQFPFFYGLGNNSERDDDLFEDGFYRLDFLTFQENAYLIRDFWQQSSLEVGVEYQFNEVEPDEEDEPNILQEPRFQNLNGIGKQHHLGLFTELELDFRDNPSFTKKGAQFWVRNEFNRNLSATENWFGKIDGFIAYYHTLPVIKGLTFVGRAGGILTFGDVPFYRLASLGSSNYLRSYVRNRFIGENAAFLNTEARLHLGVIRNPVVPLNYGVFSFWEAGRVWHSTDKRGGGFRNSIGGGVYIAPFSEAYSLVFTTGKGELDEFYFSVRLGLEIQ